MSPFCGATDTPILDFWWHLLWVSKPEWVLPYLSLAEAYVLHYTFPEIHLWCDTCQPLGGQHGSQAVSSTYLQGIGGTWNWELSCRHSQCEIRQARRSTDWAIPARMSLLSHCKWDFKVTEYSKLFTWKATWLIFGQFVRPHRFPRLYLKKEYNFCFHGVTYQMKKQCTYLIPVIDTEANTHHHPWFEI